MINAFKNLKLGKKMYVGFFAVLLVLVALSIISYFNFTNMYEANNWNKHTFEVLLQLDGALQEMTNMETGQRGFALTGDENSLEPFNNGKNSFSVYFNEAKKLTADNPKQQELLNRLLEEQQEWLKIAEDSIEQKRQTVNGIGSINDIVKSEQEAKGKASFDEFRRIISESSAMEKELLAIRAIEAENLQKSTTYFILFGTIIAVILAILIAYFITRMITRPINEIKVIAESVASGDLDVDIKVESNDELGALAKAIKTMVRDLNNVISRIALASEQVAAGSRQISNSSMILSQGATEQASSVEELTSSLEELSSQTNQNANSANKANELAKNAMSNAAKGNVQMQEMLRAMTEINVSSNNISKIIKVIDDIAFQTNILALNAAVEAARAGQHGKGFAVVAEEVRTLAARSANAAKETTDMIESSIKKVEAGTKIANETAEALDTIVNETEKAANIVNDIAVASNEQAAGIGQINQGVMQVSAVIQSNSSTSEESAAASEELSNQADQLKDLVNKFKLKKNSLGERLDGISPDILKILENMADNRREGLVNKPDSHKESAVADNSKAKRIVLSDSEFGKY